MIAWNIFRVLSINNLRNKGMLLIDWLDYYIKLTKDTPCKGTNTQTIDRCVEWQWQAASLILTKIIVEVPRIHNKWSWFSIQNIIKNELTRNIPATRTYWFYLELWDNIVFLDVNINLVLV